jgi:hypothetical protein
VLAMLVWQLRVSHKRNKPIATLRSAAGLRGRNESVFLSNTRLWRAASWANSTWAALPITSSFCKWSKRDGQSNANELAESSEAAR